MSTTTSLPAAMRAMAWVKQGEAVSLQELWLTVPEPGPDEALVQVEACGVNRLDLLVRDGLTPRPVAFPHVGGSEVAGRIAALGPAVSGRAVGERVVVCPYLSCGRCEFCLAGRETLCLQGDILGLGSPGGYAQLVRVPARALVPLPDPLSPVQGAALGLAALTAFHMLFTRARLRAGETVLVIAAGSGVGSAAVQLAKAAGARVLATVGNEAKRGQAAALGADEVLLHHEPHWAEQVRRLTGKRGVDVVVESVGSPVFAAAVATLARGGRLVTCGAFAGTTTPLNLWTLFAKELELLGAYGGGRHELRQLLQWAEVGRVRPVIDAVFPLERLADAHRRLAASEHFGKIVIQVA